MWGKGQVALAGSQGAHVDPASVKLRVEGIHPDAVAEERASGLALGGVHRKYGHRLVRKIQDKPADELVHQTGLAGSACTGNAQYRNLSLQVFLAQGTEQDVRLIGKVLNGRYQPGHSPEISFFNGLDLPVEGAACLKVALCQQVVDHALQAHLSSVIRAVDPADAISVEFLYFRGQDGAAATTKNLDVAAIALLEQIVDILEKFVVSTLIGGNGNALHVLLDGSLDDLQGRAVVPHVDDLCSTALHDAPHDVDGGIVPVKQGRGG